MSRKIPKAAHHGGLSRPEAAANTAVTSYGADMAEKNPIRLTVSLLVSNRIDTVRKCLDSVQPLLAALPSELIVVDTVGPDKTDGSLAVAREYADRIVRFEWCDDFAAARNAGLGLARGEWFLFLDDDEWFEDVSPIIDFLKSDDRRYNACLYRQRNYVDESGQEYVDACVERLVRRREGLYFKDRIHEYLEGITPPVKTIDAYVHHYGYAYGNQEAFERHWHRNSFALERMLQKQPGYLRGIMQLAQEYMRGKEFDKAEALCRGAIERNTFQAVNKYYSMIACFFTHLLMENKKWKEALDQSERLLRRPDVSELAKCQILFQRHEHADLLLPMEKLPENADAFFRLADILDADADKLSFQQMFSLGDCLSETSRASVMERALQRAFDLGDGARCWAFIHRIVEKPGERGMILAKCMPLMVRIAADANAPDRLHALIEPLLAADDCLSSFDSALKAHLESFKAYEKPERLVGFATALTLDKPYAILLKMRAADAAGNSGKLAEYFDRYCELEGAGFEDEILDMAFRNHLDLSQYAGKACISDWDKAMRRLANRCPPEQARGILQFLASFFPDGSPEVLSLKAALQLKSLRDHRAMGGAAQTEGMRAYVDLVYAYNVALVGADNFTPSRSHYLSQDARAALCLKESLEAGERGDFASQARLIKKALALRSDLVAFADLVMKDLEKQMDRKAVKPPAPANAEFQALATRLKGVVAEFILKGDFINARAVLDQMKSLLPGDPDIPKLYMQLGK